MRVCIIPARGGSKRIPRKNIRNFCGKPMIAWSIQAAQDSGCFDQIIVSTDDDDIAQVAEDHGAQAPFRRTSELADDHTPTIPVIADAIRQLKLDAQTSVCCLYATSPFVLPEYLSDGCRLLEETQARFVMSVTTFAFPIQRALRRKESGVVEMFHPENMNVRSQDLEEAWHDAGQFYWATAATWKGNKGIFECGAYGLKLPRHRVQDIDTNEDWVHAEWMMRALKSETPE
ncbi:pseudaminic acid cytidylyltransferase [Roseinatronobacter sp. S2]|uniref:pseudaminic acid cytidylyltransferase n=1 Tax=Roseinatronobacter sp. S2 TaxID=3035471 RepID=UPI0024101BF3|nr:pseudaminic acid cytidylyltransferase [Roseinatronobacter sp. S2]WFE74179.1 pseudaminic acid cytidylyltransferase [Roseinatronobacter sp. S2]